MADCNHEPIPDNAEPTPERLVNASFEKELLALTKKHSVDMAAFYQCADECHVFIDGTHTAEHTIRHLRDVALEVKKECATQNILKALEKEFS